MKEVYEAIAYYILEDISTVLDKVHVKVKVLDEQTFEILYKIKQVKNLQKKINFPSGVQETEEFIYELYETFYKNTNLYLCVKNLKFKQTTTGEDVLSFSSSAKRIQQVEESYKNAVSFTYNYKKEN